MKYSKFLILLLLSVLLTAFVLVQSHKHDHSKMQMKSDTSLVKATHQKMVKEKYACTMDPEVISDKPGKCPKCGMTLVKIKSSPIMKKSHKMQKDTSMVHPKKMH
jgi:hypothetical protein